MLVHARGTCIFIYMRHGGCVFGRLLWLFQFNWLDRANAKSLMVDAAAHEPLARRNPSSVNEKNIFEFFQITHSHSSHSLRDVSQSDCGSFMLVHYEAGMNNSQTFSQSWLRIENHLWFDSFFSIFELTASFSHSKWHEWELLSWVFPLQNHSAQHAPTRRCVLWATEIRAKNSMMAMSPFWQTRGSLCAFSIQSISAKTVSN